MNIGIASPVSLLEFYGYVDTYGQRSEELPKGMRAQSVDAIVHEFIKQGHHVSLYTLDPNVRDIVCYKGKQLSIFIAPHHLQNKLLNYLTIFKFRKSEVIRMISMDDIKLDVLHAHWTREYALGAIYFKNIIPVVVTVRDWMPQILKTNKYHLFWLCNWIMDRKVFKTTGITIIANSEYIQNQILKRWRLNTVVIPNPISHSFLTQPICFKSDNSNFRIISISNTITPNKNIETLLKAFYLFLYKCNKAELYLVGSDFNENNDTVKKWKQKGLLNRVKLIGHINHDELIAIIDESDVLAHPSFEESFGNILLESISRCRPVIAGVKSGAVPYVLAHGNFGLLCDISNSNELAKALNECYDNYNVYLAKAQCGRNYISINNNVTQIAKKTIELYKKVIKK